MMNIAAAFKCTKHKICLAVGTALAVWCYLYNAMSLDLQVDVTPNRASFENAMEIMHNERIAILKRSCERTGQIIRNDTINKHLLYSKKYKFGVCEIQKCGSSSWLRAVSVMDDYYTVEDYLANRIRGERLIKLSNRDMRFSSLNDSFLAQWQQSLKIITVRNPFARLVSAYNGKLAPNARGASSYYKPISIKISAEFRKLRQNHQDRMNYNEGMATFEDFVNYLISDKYPPDSHWQPYESNCGPCVFEYDFVVKFESLDADMRYLENLLDVSPEHRKAFFPSMDWLTKPSVVEETFKQVPKPAALRLYNKLRLDFDRFGYAKPDWLD